MAHLCHVMAQMGQRLAIFFLAETSLNDMLAGLTVQRRSLPIASLTLPPG